MENNDEINLIPQAEEGITEVKWVKKNSVSEQLKNSYASVSDVIFYSRMNKKE